MMLVVNMGFVGVEKKNSDSSVIPVIPVTAKKPPSTLKGILRARDGLYVCYSFNEQYNFADFDLFDEAREYAIANDCAIFSHEHDRVIYSASSERAMCDDCPKVTRLPRKRKTLKTRKIRKQPEIRIAGSDGILRYPAAHAAYVARNGFEVWEDAGNCYNNSNMAEYKNRARCDDDKRVRFNNDSSEVNEELTDTDYRTIAKNNDFNALVSFVQSDYYQNCTDRSALAAWCNSADYRK